MPCPASSQEATRVILSIAGSDPSGGAGIQADLKTFSAVGVYGAAAITCLTAQNSQGVVATQAISPAFVRQQIEVVLADLPVSHIKTGMIGNSAIADAIAEALSGFSGEIVCDPVLRASDGHDLFAAGKGRNGLIPLLRKATVLTPNTPELAVLTGRPVSTQQDALEAGASLLREFPDLRALILTGGHIEEKSGLIEDFLIRRTGSGIEIIPARHERIGTRNSHGTGCTFASAFAAYHLRCGKDQEAFLRAVSFMDSVLRQSATLSLGKGTGGLAHHLFREKDAQTRA